MPNETCEPEEDEQGAAGFVRVAAVVMLLLVIAGVVSFRSLSSAPEPPPAPPTPTAPRMLPERVVPPPPPVAQPPPAPVKPAFIRPEPVGDLVAHWPLDQDGRDLIAKTPWIQEGEPQLLAGPVDQATDFGPRAAYIINNEDAPQMSNPFTITTWVRLPWHNRPGDWPTIITHGGHGWRLHMAPFKRVPTLHLNKGGA